MSEVLPYAVYYTLDSLMCGVTVFGRFLDRTVAGSARVLTYADYLASF